MKKEFITESIFCEKDSYGFVFGEITGSETRMYDVEAIRIPKQYIKKFSEYVKKLADNQDEDFPENQPF